MARDMGTRGQFTGVLNVLRFNWPFYAAALATSLAAGLADVFGQLSGWRRALVLFVGGLAAYYGLASAFAAHLIYDRSRLYRWDWIADLLPNPPQRIVNVHAGFDESSQALRRLFPQARLAILDFYDATRNAEPSIARARRLDAIKQGATSTAVESLPLADGSCDAVFLILAAHEVRSAVDRREFFKEIRRVLVTDGRLVLVEHPRNLANLLAFGPGCLHFYPRQEWLRVGWTAGLVVDREFSLTPFVRCFVLAKPASVRR